MLELCRPYDINYKVAAASTIVRAKHVRAHRYGGVSFVREYTHTHTIVAAYIIYILLYGA